jgi:hypothetical protein
MAAVLENPQGHKLAAGAVAGEVLLVCLACGAWAAQKPEKLRAPCCTAPTTAGAAALARLRQGLHPGKGRGVPVRVEDLVPLWLPYGQHDRMLVDYIRIPNVSLHEVNGTPQATPAANEATQARRKSWAAALTAAAREGGTGSVS